MPENDQSLPPYVAVSLAPSLRHALDSPSRRRILRTLNAATEAQTLEELAAAIPSADLGTLSYHLSVLEREGCVSEACQIVRTNGLLRAFVSSIADDWMLLGILAATQQQDEKVSL